VDAVTVRGSELGFGLARHNGDGELGHRVHAIREALDHLRHVRRQGRALRQFLGQGGGLRLGRELAGEEQPEEALRERLRAARRLRQLILQLRDGVAAEADALLRVQQRRLVDHAADAAHATVRLLNGAGAQDLVADLRLHFDDFGNGRTGGLDEGGFLRVSQPGIRAVAQR
jgi:uncharacterized protein YPO0396